MHLLPVMNRSFATAILFALVGASSLVAGTSSAESASINSCKSAPKVTGYTVLKVKSATRAGNYTEVTFDQGSDKKLKNGQDAYMVGCDSSSRA
jgi:hypothetical protein